MRLFLILSFCLRAFAETDLPSTFDLRNADGKNYVSTVKNQSGGTCWTHGTMAAIESNLMITGMWDSQGESGEANLAEYHLDWWNGFNQHFNRDISPKTGGLTVHQGGDYKVAAAYLARGAGVVREIDGQSYQTPPKENTAAYRFYYVRDIEWLDAGDQLETIASIKQTLKENGVIGTALTWDSKYYANGTFYQPNSSHEKPNHAVSIIGWDDKKITQAAKPGAWLAKNSWGSGWGSKGYFWISYYDKVTGHHPEMGAVAFKNTERLSYSNIYSHDYHGWRDTKPVSEAFNAFTAKGNPQGREKLKSVSFYTTEDETEFSVKVYRSFIDGELRDLVSVRDGVMPHRGFHTTDLAWPVYLTTGETFYVAVSLMRGGHAFDKTSNVPLLLGGGGRPIVESRAKPGESFYRAASGWIDLTKDDPSANFCIKALTINE